MEKNSRSLKLGNCYEELKRFRTNTGISMTVAVDMAWNNFKTTKEYAVLMLLGKKNKIEGGE